MSDKKNTALFFVGLFLSVAMGLLVATLFGWHTTEMNAYTLQKEWVINAKAIISLDVITMIGATITSCICMRTAGEKKKAK